MIHRSENSFTLIELLVYISIFIIVAVFVTLFVFSFIKASSKSRIQQIISENAHSAMSTMVYEIKEANSVYTPTSIFGVSPGQLSLETNNELPEGEKITYVDFYLDNGKLYIKREGKGSQILISENIKVTELKFTHIVPENGLDSAKIDLTVEYDTPAEEYKSSYNLTSSASIR